MLRPLFSRDGRWDLLQDWPKSKILDRCRKASFWLESDDCIWLETVKKSLETSSWPGFQSFPLVTPVSPKVSPSSRDDQQHISNVPFDGRTWRICLDVRHFCPEEIGVKITEGYLEISGKHEEKLPDREIISRCFTRKYKLPAEVDLRRINSSLYPEGLLLVEVPWGVSLNGCPTETIIPIEMKEKALDLSCM